ncbi:MAG: hypothetical protein IJ689_00650 [Alphaproteobacteria bacterium]|nr:hypothetical protein [Alphaproteobacteria bacterium]
MFVNGINIEIIKGDIATVAADAYVVPQYRDHISTDGVSGRLLHSSAFRAVLDYGEAAHYMNYPFGYAVSFADSSAMCKRVICAVLLGMPQDEAFELVQMAVYFALREAEKHGLHEIAIPALGTGDKMPLDFDKSAIAIVSALAAYPNPRTVRRVVIPIVKSGRAYSRFRKAVRRYLRFVPYGLEEKAEILDYKVVFSSGVNFASEYGVNKMLCPITGAACVKTCCKIYCA